MKCICEFPCPEKTNYSVFKQQFNFDMLRPKTRAERKQLQQLVVSAFELNYGYILSFLSQAEQRTVKLISRGIYYISITSEIWTGMRLQVLDKKMELFQDIDFRQEQPKVVSKQEKQIRIHSLKKNTVTTKLRQASGMKEKKMAINTINQQLPFRNTQIGFKRLLKTNISIKPSIKSTKQLSNSLLDLVEIPKQWSSSDLIVDVKDPWSKNVHRVNNVCAIVKKWNEFHHRVTTEMKEAQSDLSGLIKKCIRVDVFLSNYLKTFESEPYLSVKQYLGGAQQQLLIDQQLNKLGKAFLLNHSQLILIAQYLQQFISSAHEVCSKLGKLRTQGQSTWIIDGLSILQQLTQTWAKISNSCPDLIRIMSKSLLQILDSLLQSFSSTPLQIAEDCISLFEISINHLSKRPDFFQVLFESYGSIITALSKVCEAGEQENMGLKLTAGKFKNLKLISHNLWSISKYFSKLVKQLEAKEKKGAAGNKSNMIKQFLQSYQNLKTPYCLLDWKNPNRSEKEVQQLKQNVGKLKSQMQNQ